MKTLTKARRTTVVDRRAPKAPPIPLNDTEAAAMYLVEFMPPAMRAELGRLLVTGTVLR